MLGWWRKKSRRRWLLFGFLLLAISVPVANEATRQITEGILGSLLEGHASVEKVRLGVRAIRVEGVQVWSADCGEPAFAVSEITAQLSIFDGLRYGIWARTIVIDQPAIQLHFDAEGKLITNLPASQSKDENSAPVATLPFREIEIRNASLAIHQAGRESFDLRDVAIHALSQGPAVAMTANAPEVFSGELKIKSTIDIGTLAAETEIHVTDLNLSSGELARGPFGSASLHTNPWRASSSLTVKQSGSLKQIDNVAASIELQRFNVSMTDRPGILHATGRLELSDSQLTGNVLGSILGGTFDLATTSALGSKSTCRARITCTSLDIDKLPNGLIPADLTTKLDVNADFNAEYASGKLQLRGSSTAKTSETNTFGVEIAPTTVRLEINGATDLTAPTSGASGAITATVVSDGISLEQLSASGIARLPRPTEASPNELKSRAKAPQLPDFVTPFGKVRGAGRIDVPLATITDPRTYSATGFLDATQVIVNDIVIRNGQGEFTLVDNNATINFPEISLVDQTNGQTSAFAAIANAGLDPKSNLQVAIRVNRISAATLARLANVVDRKVVGSIQADAELNCPMEQLSNAIEWQGKASIQAHEIRIDNELLANGDALCDVSNGVLRVQHLQGELAGGQVSANGRLQLNAKLPFEGKAVLDDLNLTQIAKLAGAKQPAFSGTIAANISTGGALLANHWRVQGLVTGSELWFGSRKFNDSRLLLDATPTLVSVRALPDEFLGGNLKVTLANLSRVEGQISDLPLSAVARLADYNDRVEGTASCHFTTNVTSDLSRLAVTARLSSPGVVVRDASLEQIQTDISMKDGLAEVDAKVNGLGGEVNVHANADVRRLVSLTPEQWKTASSLPIDATATVSDAKLQELWPVIGQKQQLKNLRGRLSMTIERGDSERSHGVVAVGDVRLRELRWDNVLWSSQLRANLVLGDRLAEIREVTGPFASGRIHARAKVALDGTNAGTFELSATRVSLRKALVPVDRKGDLANGLVSMRVNGRLGARPSGRAFVAMDRGTAGPIALARLRVPIDWSVDPSAQTVQWRTTNAGVELGGGRVVTNAKGRWNGKLDMTMTTSARRVDTGRLLAGQSSGGGFLDGTIRLKAKRAVDADDFTGTFDATLSDASSIQLPVVSDLTKFLKTIPSTTSFDESRIQGRLGNGMIHLDRVTLAAANAQILAEGSATLQGRLNLKVMAKTDETGPADKLLELADSPLLMAAPTPIGLVAKANNALKDRVVHLRVGGTAARPVIRLEPGRQIGQEAIKFFMNQAIALRDKNDELSFK